MSPPPSKDQPSTQEFKVKDLNGDRLSKRTFQVQLQGVLLIAVDDACRETERTPRQLMLDLLTQYLKREGHLPGWYR